jgi:uracil-DNA glycosylase
MQKIDPVMETSWKNRLRDQFGETYFHALKEFLITEKRQHRIYPPGQRIFAAFDYTPFDEVKVVIIGQDPYHGAGQANGLCFSVTDGISHPPSLMNIFKELQSDLGHPYPKSGNLEKWARQGVLLLNAILTVRANTAGSHQNRGWETFTNAAIQKLSVHRDRIVFLLWGKYAQQKEQLIDTGKHAVLKCGHPSPMSANQGLWFGNRHFSRTNEILRDWEKTEIDWKIE